MVSDYYCVLLRLVFYIAAIRHFSSYQCLFSIIGSICDLFTLINEFLQFSIPKSTHDSKVFLYWRYYSKTNL